MPTLHCCFGRIFLNISHASRHQQKPNGFFHGWYLHICFPRLKYNILCEMVLHIRIRVLLLVYWQSKVATDHNRSTLLPLTIEWPYWYVGLTCVSWLQANYLFLNCSNCQHTDRYVSCMYTRNEVLTIPEQRNSNDKAAIVVATVFSPNQWVLRAIISSGPRINQCVYWFAGKFASKSDWWFMSVNVLEWHVLYVRGLCKALSDMMKHGTWNDEVQQKLQVLLLVGCMRERSFNYGCTMMPRIMVNFLFFVFFRLLQSTSSKNHASNYVPFDIVPKYFRKSLDLCIRI